MRRLFGILSAFALLVGTAGPALADVDPPTVKETIAAGESHDVTKTVDVPAVPPKLDLCLIVDLSGSYNDDLPNIKAKAQDIVDGVREEVPDSQFGLGTFVDFPFSPWGSAETGDYAWMLDQAMTADGAAWVAAVNALFVRFGADEPESQYEALFQAATGAGRDVPPEGASLGDVDADQDCGFRADASKVIAITTDASFHTPNDSDCTAPEPCPFGYPGPSRDDTVNALNAQNIAVIAIKAPGSGEQMDDVANATGGAVVTTGATSEEIVDAILEGLEAISRDITGNPVGCDPLVVTFEPTVHKDVVGGEGVQVVFTETITAPAGTAPGEYICTVDFLADDAVIATQDITITVVTEVCEAGQDCQATASNDEATATVECDAGQATECESITLTVDDEPSATECSGTIPCEVSGFIDAEAAEGSTIDEKKNTFLLLTLDVDEGLLGPPPKVKFFVGGDELGKCKGAGDIDDPNSPRPKDTPCIYKSTTEGDDTGDSIVQILFRLFDLDQDPPWGVR